MRATTRKARGFTLIELMIVVAIIGVLAAVAIPAFLNYIKRSKTAEARLNLRQIYDAAASYYASHQTNPDGFVYSSALPQRADSSIAAPGRAPVPPAEQRWNSQGGPSSAWGTIGFASGEPTYYKYDFRSVPATEAVEQGSASREEACPTDDVDGVAVDVSVISSTSGLDAGGLFRDGRGFYVCAQGDLDANDARSYFWRIARVADDIPGADLIAAGGLRVVNELE